VTVLRRRYYAGLRAFRLTTDARVDTGRRKRCHDGMSVAKGLQLVADQSRRICWTVLQSRGDCSRSTHCDRHSGGSDRCP
jgi:hypothetical protein